MSSLSSFIPASQLWQSVFAAVSQSLTGAVSPLMRGAGRTITEGLPESTPRITINPSTLAEGLSEVMQSNAPEVGSSSSNSPSATARAIAFVAPVLIEHIYYQCRRYLQSQMFNREASSIHSPRQSSIPTRNSSSWADLFPSNSSVGHVFSSFQRNPYVDGIFSHFFRNTTSQGPLHHHPRIERPIGSLSPPEQPHNTHNNHQTPDPSLPPPPQDDDRKTDHDDNEEIFNEPYQQVEELVDDFEIDDDRKTDHDDNEEISKAPEQQPEELDLEDDLNIDEQPPPGNTAAENSNNRPIPRQEAEALDYDDDFDTNQQQPVLPASDRVDSHNVDQQLPGAHTPVTPHGENLHSSELTLIPTAPQDTAGTVALWNADQQLSDASTSGTSLGGTLVSFASSLIPRTPEEIAGAVALAATVTPWIVDRFRRSPPTIDDTTTTPELPPLEPPPSPLEPIKKKDTIEWKGYLYEITYECPASATEEDRQKMLETFKEILERIPETEARAGVRVFAFELDPNKDIVMFLPPEQETNTPNKPPEPKTVSLPNTRNIASNLVRYTKEGNSIYLRRQEKNEGEVVQEKQDLFPETEPSQKSPIGLRNNNHNMCYANAILQLFSSIPTLRQQSINQEGTPLSTILTALEAEKTEKDTLCSTIDTRSLCSSQEETTRQQDAMEIFKRLAPQTLQISTTTTKKYASNPSLDPAVLSSLGYRTTSEGIFKEETTQQLPVIAILPKRNASVQELVREPLKLRGDPLTEPLQANIRLEQTGETTHFDTSPGILILHVARTENGTTINRTPITLDTHITLPENQQKDQPTYRRRGFVIHRGETAANGHYIAYTEIKEEDGSTGYYEINDARRTRISRSAYLKAAEQSYLAFYEKTPSASTTTPSPQRSGSASAID